MRAFPPSTPGQCRGKKPSGTRFLFAWWFLLLCLVVVEPIGAQESPAGPRVVTEDEAVRRALERRPYLDLWEARIDGARARSVSAGTWQNPRFEYSREQSFEEPNTVAEDFFVLEMTLPLSGRRGLLARAAEESADVVRSEVEAEKRQLTARVRRAFYRVLALQNRLEIYGEWLEMMREVEADLVQRVDAGESAPYELARLRREMADIVASGDLARAELARERTELAGWMGGTVSERPLRVRGVLLPQAIPSDEELRAAVDRRPELTAARRRVAAARLRQEAASRWWVPEPTLSGGYKGAHSGDEYFHGFLAGINLAVPIFDQREGERLAADAEVVRAENRREIVKQRLLSNALGLAREARQLEEAAARYRKEGVERASKVLQMASGAYDSGEMGVLVLVDAYRGSGNARLRALELSAEARERQIDLQQTLESVETIPLSDRDQ